MCLSWARLVCIMYLLQAQFVGASYNLTVEGQKMADKKRTAAQQGNIGKQARSGDVKQAPSQPKPNMELVELDDMGAGAVCDVTTGQCT